MTWPPCRSGIVDAKTDRCEPSSNPKHGSKPKNPVVWFQHRGAPEWQCGAPNLRLGGQMPVTDRAWAIGNLRKLGAPSAKFPQIANLQWYVYLHSAQCGNTFRGSFCSIRGTLPRSLLNPGIHSEVLPCSRGHILSSRRWGPNPPL